MLKWVRRGGCWKWVMKCIRGVGLRVLDERVSWKWWMKGWWGKKERG